MDYEHPMKAFFFFFFKSEMFGPNVADKCALATTSDLGCNSWPSHAGHFLIMHQSSVVVMKELLL